MKRKTYEVDNVPKLQNRNDYLSELIDNKNNGKVVLVLEKQIS